jgi:hypothetical protein
VAATRCINLFRVTDSTTEQPPLGRVIALPHMSGLSNHAERPLLFVIQWFSVGPYLYFGLFSVRHDLRFKKRLPKNTLPPPKTFPIFIAVPSVEDQ